MSSLSSEAVASNDGVQSLRDKKSKGLDKYLQDVEQCRVLELNYFDDTTRPTSVEPMSEAAEQNNKSSEYNSSPTKQMPMEETVSAMNIPESLKRDTSCTSRPPSQPCTDTDKKCQQSPSPECAEQDANAHQEDDEHSDVEVVMPTEKVGCTLVTRHLQQFLEDYPPSSDKQAFLDVYHMLSLLDKYLYDNLKQHTHCMSSDDEYVILLKYRFKYVSDSLACTLYSPGYSRWQT